MPLPDLSGKVALITGASRGIGADCAADWSARGMRLALCSRSQPALAASDDVLAERVDVSDAEAFGRFAQAAIERFGRIDLWVNNAGVLDPIAPLRDVKLEDFQQHIEINLTGVFIGTQLFVRHVREREGEGVLINVSSGAAWSAYAGWATYCAGKAGLERLTECVALEEEGTGLRAYSVAPGVVDTAMQDRIRASTPEDFPQVERFKQMKQEEAFNTGAFVAQEFIKLAFDPEARPEKVAHQIPFG